MIKSDFIDLTYELESIDNILAIGQSVNGKIFMRPHKTIGFDFIECILQYEIKGKLNIGKEVIQVLTLDRNKTLTKDNLYAYKINLETNDEPVSFTGTNLEIVWSLQLNIILDGPTRSTLRSQFLKDASFKSIFKSFSGRIKEKLYLEARNLQPTYDISGFSKSIENTSHISTVVGIFLLAITVLLYSQEIVGFLSYVAIAIGVGAIGYSLYKKLSIGILGKVSLTGNTYDNKGFELGIKIQKNHQKIESLSIYYTVNEEVIDDRGTGTTTYRETVFTCPRKNFRRPVSNNFKIQLDYPYKDLPISFKSDKARLYTRIHMEFEFSNYLSYSLKEEFPMNKK